MKVAIYGACERGTKIKKMIENMTSDKITIINFIDKDENKANTNIEGIKIISLKYLEKKLIDKIIIATNEIHHMEIVMQLSKLFKIEDIFILKENTLNSTDISRKYKFLELFQKVRPTLSYLEFHVTDDCNLNCKGCGHFSNLAPKNSFANFEQFKKDIKRLSELFYNILKIRIMGGEPLLNEELDKFIVCTRKVFPHADLRIVTNGILVPKIADNLVNVIKENRVSIDVSWYEPTIRMKNDIISFLKKNDLNFNQPNINRKEKFFKQLTLSDLNNKYDSANECISKKCHFLEKGNISKCGIPFLIKYLKKHIDINQFSEDDIKRSIIDIYDEKIDGFQVFDFLNEPSEFCKYCSKVHEFYDWETRNSNDAQLDDWVITTEKK